MEPSVQLLGLDHVDKCVLIDPTDHRYELTLRFRVDDGVDEGFEIEYEGFTAFVSYKAEIREDAGDYWTAPSWTIEKESTTVAAVWDEQGNEYPEIAEALQVLLN